MKILSAYIEKDRNVFYAYITVNSDNSCLFHYGEMDKHIFNKLLPKLADEDFTEYFNKTNAVVTAKTVMVIIYKLHNYLKNIQDTEVYNTIKQLLYEIEKYKIEIDYKMIYKKMAKDLGYKSIDDMFNKISAKEFSEQIVSFKIKEKFVE